MQMHIHGGHPVHHREMAGTGRGDHGNGTNLIGIYIVHFVILYIIRLCIVLLVQ
jgi:hypothetical protein